MIDSLDSMMDLINCLVATGVSELLNELSDVDDDELPLCWSLLLMGDNEADESALLFWTKQQPSLFCEWSTL